MCITKSCHLSPVTCTPGSIAFLGAGRLAKALIKGFLQSGVLQPNDIFVTSKSGTTAQHVAGEYGLTAVADNATAVTNAEVIFLCTKPADVVATLSALQPHLKNKLIISVAAGITCDTLFQAAGKEARIIRTMPNTAVRLRKGVTSITAHPSATGDDVAFAKKLFSSVGAVFEISEENKNALSAVSGSGPAFALLFLEGLMQGGIDEGLDPDIARSLAAHTLIAAASLILETEETPEALRTEITSPKGMTAAGTAVLEEANLLNTVKAAIHAAKRRAEEMASS